MFLAMALLMPFLTGQIPQVGSMLCPMHIPVILCGFFCGGPWGLIVGFVASIVMGIMASYRYAMAVYVMADDPTTKIRDCVRRSCEVMKKRKMELFTLELSFIGWSLLLSLAQSMLLNFGTVIAMTLTMFASLFLNVYKNCAQAAFYQEYAVGPVVLPDPEDEVAEELT